METGSVLLDGRLVLTAALARGSHARVWRARDLADGEDVAVKVAEPGASAAARVRAEGRALAAIESRWVVRLRATGEAEDRPLLVLDLLPGPSLSAAPRGALAMTVSWVADAACGLAAVHAAGLVHGDVSPTNLLLDAEGRVRLLDLGTTRHAGEPVLRGSVVGTVPFLAPEAVRGDARAPASDVFSLGLVLLELLTGRREYPSAGVDGAVARLHRLPRVPTSLPTAIARPLARALVDEPADRPSAQAFAAALTLVSADTRDLVRGTTHGPGVHEEATAALLLSDLLGVA